MVGEQLYFGVFIILRIAPGPTAKNIFELLVILR